MHIWSRYIRMVEQPPTYGLCNWNYAVLAALMSMHSEMPHFQKIIWLLLIGGFLFLEFRAIDWDRTNSDTHESLNRMQEREQFRNILAQDQVNFDHILQQNQIQFRQTAAKMGVVSKLAKESVDEITGGDAFCYLIALPPGQIPDQTLNAGGKWPLLVVNSSRTIPLTGVAIGIKESLPPNPTQEEVLRFLNPRSYTMLGINTCYPVMQGSASVNYSIPPGTYAIWIQTRNRAFDEILSIKFDQKLGRYVTECSVMRVGDGKVVYTCGH
jgi:hypothetical protein